MMRLSTAFTIFISFIGIFEYNNNLYAQTNQTGVFTDNRDCKIYKTVKIGEQWMMAENLAYKPEQGNYWAYGNDLNNVTKFGYLYDWQTAKSVAPKGWHLPTEADFKILKKSLGGKRDIYKYLGGTMEKVYKKMITGGDSGFNALLCGIRTNNGKFVHIGNRTDFWSSSKSENGQYFFILDGKIDGKSHGIFDSKEGIAYLAEHQDNAVGGKSIRLFKD